jgi:hypothetical protein
MGMQQLNAETIMGFSDKGSLNQNQIEIEYDQNINALEMDKWMRHLSKKTTSCWLHSGKRECRIYC